MNSLKEKVMGATTRFKHLFDKVIIVEEESIPTISSKYPVNLGRASEKAKKM